MSDVANPASIDAVLAQMREIRAQAGQALQADLQVDRGTAPDTRRPAEFQQMLNQALDSVNETQRESGRLTDSFVRGEHEDLVAVMVAQQKASVSFQALNQVRNRMVSAYQDVMNMPI